MQSPPRRSRQSRLRSRRSVDTLTDPIPPRTGRRRPSRSEHRLKGKVLLMRLTAAVTVVAIVRVASLQAASTERVSLSVVSRAQSSEGRGKSPGEILNATAQRGKELQEALRHYSYFAEVT